MSGGGSSGPTTSTSNTTNLPTYAQPYVMQMLGNAQSLTTTPYQQYGGQQVAGFSPLQNQAFQNIQQMQPSGQTQQATGMAGMAGLGSGAYANSNNDFYNNQVGDYSGANVNKYMSPYMNDVVNQQKIAATSDYARLLPNQNAAASAAGAMGGTRNDVVQSEAGRNLQQQLQGIQATGSQAAFQNAQQQFNTQQQMNMQNANQAAQWGATGRQIGLQGLNQELNAANTLGNLGQQQFQQQAGIDTALLGAGSLQQQQQQSGLNTSYQNYLNQLNYPYSQLGFMSSLLHGLPMSQGTSNLYQASPNAMGQVAGLGMGLGSLFGALG